LAVLNLVSNSKRLKSNFGMGVKNLLNLAKPKFLIAEGDKIELN
jgi:hypothetical protein